ncbi:MAG TPA: class I SAM-dependent methyltransferase [Bacteroidia bacterium]|nr:class I SAM-dependent methyltransferase [Bacteroidia bacterium]
MNDWFKSWFDSPYYHLLYKHRNDAEAKVFLDTIIRFLHPPPGSLMVDQACGKGRHAKYLNSLGFDVTGIDLSQQSIAYCKKFENDHLQFYVHDMRRIFRTNYFDFVFNIFTSIGYFRHDHDQQLAVDCGAIALKKGGKYIIDFMNVLKVLNNLKKEETKTVDSITFNIHKKAENGFITKKIQFTDGGKNYQFEEIVQALTMKDFERYFKHAGLTAKNVFGNYALEKFDEQNSDRLIIVAEKTG